MWKYIKTLEYTVNIKKKDLRIFQLNDENSENIKDLHDCDNISGKAMNIFV